MRPLFVVSAVFTLLAIGVASWADETLFVSSLSPDGVNTSPLAAGTLYELVATGTWVWNGAPQFQADAQWATVDHWQTHDWPNSGVQVGGSYPNWHWEGWLGSSDGVTWTPNVYSPDHVYKHYFVGTGEALHLWIGDSLYADNSGGVTVRIAEVVPEPTGMLITIVGFGSVAGCIRWRRR